MALFRRAHPFTGAPAASASAPRRRRILPLILALAFGTAAAVLPLSPAAATEGPRIVAQLSPPATGYEARGFDDDGPDPIYFYEWQAVGLECGDFFSGPPSLDPNQAVWVHDCGDHATPSHPGTIILDVFHAFEGTPLAFTCEYEGSLSGESHCEAVTPPIGEDPPDEGDETDGGPVVDDDGAECPLAEHSTIQAGVDAAAPEETVTVCDGTYRENVEIRKPLNINGAGSDRTFVLAEGFGPALGAFGAGSVNISGLTVDGENNMDGDATNRAYGIGYEGTDGLIESVRVLNIAQAINGVMGIGINVLPNDSPSVHIKDTLVKNFSYAGIVGNGPGVHVNVSDTWVVGPSGVQPGLLNGVKFIGGATGSVSDSGVWRLHTESGQGMGIHYNGSPAPQATDNRVWDVDIGVRLGNTQDATIHMNWVEDATGTAFLLEQKGSGQLEGNNLTSNWAGGVMDGFIQNAEDPSRAQGNSYESNQVFDTGECGLTVTGGSATVVTNQFTDIGRHAMHVDGGSFSTFSGNSASNVGHNGIRVDDGTWNHFTGTTIRDAAKNGVLVQDGWNYFTDNDIRGSGKSGIWATESAVANEYERNKIKKSGEVDAWDASTGGGTAGTASLWIKNKCKTSSPDGLCKTKAKEKPEKPKKSKKK